MADLDVQPKKKGSILPWILLALGILALLIFLMRGCNKNKTDTVVADTVSSTTPAPVASAASGWDSVDFNAPAATYAEISGKDISVRGNNNYGIYGLGENILFDEGKSDIRSDGEASLKQIAASITKRYNGASVRVYGYTDSVGSKTYNKELAEKRAEAVRAWLVKNGSITENNTSLQPVGDARPVASNATSEGRQQNRRVEIVARAASGGK